MADIIRLKRGAVANIPQLSQGEPGFTLDSGEEALYIGNGAGNANVKFVNETAVNGKVSEHAANSKHFFKNYKGEMLQIHNPFVLKSNQYKGNTHSHTSASDGSNTAIEMMSAYRDAGYHFNALTDHNMITADPAVGTILYIPGVEETFSVSGDVKNSSHFVRMNPATASYGATLATFPALPAGSIKRYKHIMNNYGKYAETLGLAHPADSTFPVIDEFLKDLYGYALFEIATGSAIASAKYDIALSAGRRCYCVGCDDSHATNQVGQAFTVVNSDALSVDAILTAIREGNCYASNGALISNITLVANRITITAPVASEIKFIGKNGVVLKVTGNTTTEYYDILGDEGYVRAEIKRASDNKIAWSQPIFINKVQTKEDVLTPVSMSFTPELKSTGGTYAGNAYTTQTGQLFKFGNIVFFTILVALSAKDSGMTGECYINMPFELTQYNICSLYFRNIAIGTDNAIIARADPGSDKRIRFFEQGNNVNAVTLAPSKITATTYLNITGFGFVDE